MRRWLGLAFGLPGCGGALVVDPTETDATEQSDSSLDTDSGGSTGSDADSATSVEATDTGDDRPDCESTAFRHAPPATTIDELPAVPIDILAIDAGISFDGARSLAEVDVTLEFALGPAAGMPIFDLRQSIAAAELDGERIDPGLMARHDFGQSLAYGFRILERDLEACSTHTLWLTYDLTIPDAPGAEGLEWASEPTRLYFDTWFSDLSPGRYLESWLPANLPFDRHAITIDLELLDAGTAHSLISNAELEALGEHHWQLEFPATSSAMSPLIVVVPSEDIETRTGVHLAANGQDIPYSLHRHWTMPITIDELEIDLHAYLDEFTLSTGEFPELGLTAYLGGAVHSMEYAGALTATPGQYQHEVFHSWWARGVEPATYAEGWIDEAWTTYNTSGGDSFSTLAFDWQAPPIRLLDPHPFARDTALEAYTEGPRVFAGLAAIVGVDALRSSLADLYTQLAPDGVVTSSELELHLYCAFGSDDIRQAFWQFVHGQVGPVPAPTQPCP